MFGKEKIRTQRNKKSFINPKDIFKSAKNIFKNLTLKRTPLKLPYLKFKAKFVTETKPQRSNTTFERILFL